MARIKIRYFIEKPGARDKPRYYWQPDRTLRIAGFQPRRLGDRLEDAIQEAERINSEVDRWRAAGGLPETRAKRPAAAAPGSLAELVQRFRRSEEWEELAAKTQASYEYAFALLLAWSREAPIGAITAKRIKTLHASFAWQRDPKDKSQWLRDDKGKRVPLHPSKANLVVRVLRLLLEYARREGDIEVNPALRPRLVDTARKGRLWSPAALTAFIAAADALGHHSIGTAVALDEWLGQRLGDLLARSRAAYRDGRIWVEQSKTGAEVDLPVDLVPTLKARLEAELERQRKRTVTATALLVCESTGCAWNVSHFAHTVAEIRALAIAGSEKHGLAPCPELDGLWFMHLRHTAVTRLAEAGCETAMIAAITGHSLKTVEDIIDRYLIRTGKLARAAFKRRLEAEAEDAAENEKA